MKLGVMTPVLYSMGLEDAVKYLSGLGVQAVEIGCGGYPTNQHLNPKDYFDNPAKVDELKSMLAKYNMEISALSCHGNPVHPNAEVAAEFHNDFIDTMKMAQLLGVDTVIGFSGCPGDSATSQKPNWVTCAWPNEFGEILEWQWNEVLIPYWKGVAAEAAKYGVTKIALEMHPGFCVYNPETLLKLRAAVGDIIGANFDPSHLFWQGIDAAQAILHMGNSIHHFHAKDTKIDAANTAINGVLDTKSLGDIPNRSWLFRTVGYGNGYEVWNEIFSALKVAGYDGVISIEHEDALMSPKEGLEKAIAFLKQTMIFEQAGEAWWV